jgi:hypothetical protein
MEEVKKLLDNGWQVLIFRDGLGQYSALAVRDDRSVDQALGAWADHDPLADGVPVAESVFDGPNRYCGCGITVEMALRAVTEKVLFSRLPGEE